MQLTDLCDYIETELESSRFKDYCPNGLQVEGKPEAGRIATAVTASQAVLEAANNWGADAILVHHGYFWRDESAPITGIKKRRIAHLLRHDISLLAYHLPLDAHPLWGNNTQMAKHLGFVEQGRFGEQDVACYGCLLQPQALGDLVRVLEQKLQRTPQVIGDMRTKVTRIAWCSGAAQSYFEQAVALGVDAFLTGEISEQNVHVAEETGVAFIAAGHHATERYGIQALGQHLASRFGLEHRFFDQQNPV
ncbi:MAG: Nif3-like dinuclear metal center hexameric protein [Sideroxyarcus sp.]|nr:Nif3-like dinuclear metal center hexameric protein [Sideroxyarcus sp.]